MILFGSGAMGSTNLLLGAKWDSTEAYFWEGQSQIQKARLSGTSSPPFRKGGMGGF
jgi:hypothetical protein